jgi:hypothetical protein
MWLWILAAAANEPAAVTCTVRTTWMERDSDPVTGATAAEARIFEQSATGSETETREALKKACRAAIAAPDVDGVPKSEIAPCTVVCQSPLRIGRPTGAGAARDIALQSKDRLEPAIRSCAEKAAVTGDPALTLEAVADGGALVLQPLPEHPELHACLAPILARLPAEDGRVTWRLQARP